MKDKLKQVAKKGSEPRKITATVFYPSGGAPSVEKVAPNDRDILEIRGKSFKITPGSVWSYNGQDHTLVNWENAQTINAAAIIGDDIFGPEVAHTIDSDNLAMQLRGEMGKGGIWSNPMAWGVGLAAIFVVLALFYIGSSVNGLQDAIEAVRIALEGMEGGSGGNNANEGHQPIGRQ